MRRLQIHLVLGVVMLAALAGSARAQERYPYRAALYYGLGGSLEGGDSIDNDGFQLGFSWISDTDVLVGIRYGELDFGDDGPGGRVGGDLTFVDIGGEYLFNEGYYTSGLYIGLGYYELSQDDLGLVPSDSSIGIAVGFTGDFRLTARFSILVELSGHYTELEDVDIFAMGHAGVGFRF